VRVQLRPGRVADLSQRRTGNALESGGVSWPCEPASGHHRRGLVSRPRKRQGRRHGAGPSDQGHRLRRRPSARITDMNRPLLTVAIHYEQDVVVARQRARQIASLLGFDGQDQTRIATAVSEIARNAYRYAKGGKVEFALEGQSTPQLLLVRIEDQGPGIGNLERILSGNYR